MPQIRVNVTALAEDPTNPVDPEATVTFAVALDADSPSMAAAVVAALRHASDEAADRMGQDPAPMPAAVQLVVEDMENMLHGRAGTLDTRERLQAWRRALIGEYRRDPASSVTPARPS